MVILVGGFYAALRWEEICKIDIGTMREHWEEATEGFDHRHIPLMMANKFKGGTGLKLFCQSLTLKTRSGTDIKEVFFRTLSVLEKLGVTSGHMYSLPDFP